MNHIVGQARVIERIGAQVVFVRRGGVVGGEPGRIIARIRRGLAEPGAGRRLDRHMPVMEHEQGFVQVRRELGRREFALEAAPVQLENLSPVDTFVRGVGIALPKVLTHRAPVLGEVAACACATNRRERAIASRQARWPRRALLAMGRRPGSRRDQDADDLPFDEPRGFGCSNVSGDWPIESHERAGCSCVARSRSCWPTGVRSWMSLCILRRLRIFLAVKAKCFARLPSVVTGNIFLPHVPSCAPAITVLRSF